MEDQELLLSLGASVVDQETFEQKLLLKLEEKFNGSSTELPCDDNKVSDDEPNSERTELENSGTTENLTPSQDDPDDTGSLDNLAECAKSDGNTLMPLKESEDERKIRTGEMTPFGTVIEKTGVKKDSFLNFNKYLTNQMSLQKSRDRKPKADAKDNSSSQSDKITQPKQRSSGHTSSKSLNMNILFPKKKRKKTAIGTGTSDDPSDLKRKVGRSVAERTSMYVDPNEDSDYIPSDSDLSDEEVKSRPCKRQKLIRSTKKNKIIENSSDNSSEYESEDIERPHRRLKKEADDGNYKYYQTRVRQWKENETRFTGDFHTFEGGFKIPLHLWESLYNYQKVGVKWLWELHQQRCGGVLGDEMGLGKTIQMISFLAGLACSNLMFRFSKYRGLGPSLIVCPVTVMHQWVKEFHTWWPPFRIAVLHDSGSYGGTKNALIQSIQECNGILITSYVGVVHNQQEILKYTWHYVILDEGHKIRNPDAQVTLTIKQVTTPHRLILSGSPLQNNLKELWSLFDFVYPGKLGTLPAFMEQFAVPITQGGYSNATEIQVAAAFKCATILRDIINPYLLRRMKSDVKAHLNLPEKNEQVLFCKMTEEQRALYISYVNSKEIDSIIQGRFNLFVGLINLRKICNHPHLFDGGPKLIKSNQKHRIPKNKANMEKSSFPSSSEVSVDHKDLDEEDESDLELDPKDSFGHWSKSGKMIVVETLLRLWYKQKHKVLLFTQSRQMLCILENFVRQKNYSYLRLDGLTSIGSRQPMIQKFNEDASVFVFILTTRVGGLGVNLTGANRVIIFDPDWNPSTDLQARERAWRIGQDRQVTIYRLITSGTIEEKIYHRQIFKQFLTNRVLKDPKQKRFFKSNDLLELFSYNEGMGGTESEAIFAGTGSSVKVHSKSQLERKRQRKEAREKSSGKFRDVPNLVKQSKEKNNTEEAVVESEKNQNNMLQDEYVLRKLFSKSGVEAALRHDRIVDTNEADYMLIEQEAERVARDAIKVLKKSREQCWNPQSGNVNWTGSHGCVKAPVQPKLRFGPKKTVSKVSEKAVEKSNSSDNIEQTFFSGPPVEADTDKSQPMSSSDLLSIIRSRNRPLVPSANEENTNEEAGTSTQSEGNTVGSEHLELLRDIREFISFQAIVDGQATTGELITEFGSKLPAKDSPLFKQMLGQLCTFRRVEGQGIWRLKPEFR